MSIPILISPLNNSVNTSVSPTFEWLHLFDSTTNGPLQDYTIEIDNDPDFSSIEESAITVSPNYTKVQPLSESLKYYWRVKAIYSSPPNSNNGWSDVWTFSIQGSPPTPSILTPQNNEHIKGIYKITAISDPDTASIDFNYYDGVWHFIGSGLYDSEDDEWIYYWNTTNLNLINITISANATNEIGLKGGNLSTGIEIDNTAPNPTFLAPSENEHIRGLYYLIAQSDPDTITLEFYYFDGNWHLIGTGSSFVSDSSKWYYIWDTSDLDLTDVIISVNATDEVGLNGSNAITGISINDKKDIFTGGDNLLLDYWWIIVLLIIIIIIPIVTVMIYKRRKKGKTKSKEKT